MYDLASQGTDQVRSSGLLLLSGDESHTVKKETNISAYSRIFRRDRLQVISEEGLPFCMYEEIRKYIVIHGEAVSHL